MPMYSSREQALLVLNNNLEHGEEEDDQVANIYSKVEQLASKAYVTDLIPKPLQDNQLNASNHMIAIDDYGLGPADPRQPNEEFWQNKAVIWAITSGNARGRLCANCVYYFNTSQITDAIRNGPAWNLKASDLPLDPAWEDIESHPTAYCDLLEITCSPIRTCNRQLPGGPIDNTKALALGLDVISEES